MKSAEHSRMMPAAEASLDGSSAIGVRPLVRRLESIDLLRGLLMLLMALDHTRDFFSAYSFDPVDPTKSWAALFATRWITHLCAPGFIALAGTSVYLQRQRGKSHRQLMNLLLTRGLWLVLLELTVVSFAWSFSEIVYVQVIWAVGVAMIFLAVLQWLPAGVVGVIGAVILLLHNLLDPVQASGFSHGAVVWDLIHQQAVLQYGGLVIVIVYPVLPWIGVICVGYAFGVLATAAPALRRRTASIVGGLMLVAFGLLRLMNGYGDHIRFHHLATSAQTGMSFFRVEKYPPSLHYILATFGILLLLYALFDKAATQNWLPRLREFVEVYGRVPFFFYVCHLYLIHSAALCLSAAEHLNWRFWITPGAMYFGHLQGWGFSLVGVYGVWLCIILALYPPCLWFSRLKARRRDWWLSYL